MWGEYHVDVGRCMSDKQEFRNHMQRAHAAPFPGPAREFGCSRMYNGYSTTFTEWLRLERCVVCLVKEVIEIVTSHEFQQRW